MHGHDYQSDSDEQEDKPDKPPHPVRENTAQLLLALMLLTYPLHR